MTEESDFEGVAARLLSRWAEAIEEAEADGVEVEAAPGMVTLDIDGTGTWVISKHAPTRQIWLSSPISGASHFAPKDERWISTRGDGADLALRLAAELKQAAGLDLILD